MSIWTKAEIQKSEHHTREVCWPTLFTQTNTQPGDQVLVQGYGVLQRITFGIQALKFS
jgi:hypothetical protein